MSIARPSDDAAMTRMLIRRLTKVLPLFADECVADTPDQRQALLSRVFFALEAERDRGRDSYEKRQHWAYSLPRHAELWCVYQDMRAHFLAIDREHAA